jgi:hypothetical protein
MASLRATMRSATFTFWDVPTGTYLIFLDPRIIEGVS